MKSFRATRIACAVIALTASAGMAGDPVPSQTQSRNLNLTASGVMALQSAKAALQADPTLRYDPGTVLVKFAENAPRNQTAQLVAGAPVRQFPLVPGLVQLEVGIGVEQAIELLEALPWVEYAEPDYVMRSTATPNDSFYDLQWGLHNTGQNILGTSGIPDADIDAPAGWDVRTGTATFTVGVIDSGVQWNHPDLNDNIWTNPGEIAGNGIDDDGNGYVDDIRGWDFFGDDNNPTDDDGHGTHVAGTIGAEGNNGTGVVGVCWDVQIVPMRFIGPNGGFTSDAIASLNYLVDKGVRVSNNSYGGGGFLNSFRNAIENAKAVDHLFVAAAGNDGKNIDTSPEYPAAYNNTNLISVANINNRDGLSATSNWGSTNVDLGGPGSAIASTYAGSGYVYLSGTSMASPHVAGVAALVFQNNPTFGWSEVKDQIMDNVRPISALSGRSVSGGMVNLSDALGPPAANTPPTVSIASPSAGATFDLGQSVTFTGVATDAEDGTISSSLLWNSSLNGFIGTGASFSTSSLAAGTHTITATVSDSGGLFDNATRTITIEEPAGDTPPATPGRPTASDNGDGTTSVTWADNSDNEDSFQIQRQERNFDTRQWVNLTTFTNSANDNTLEDNTGEGRFRYRVRARNSAGNSSWSQWRVVNVTNGGGGPSGPPATPGRPSITDNGGGNVTVTWADNSDNEDSFQVQRQERDFSTRRWVNTTIVANPSANTTSLNDSPGEGRFRYRVRARNTDGFSSWSNWRNIDVN